MPLRNSNIYFLLGRRLLFVGIALAMFALGVALSRFEEKDNLGVFTGLSWAFYVAIGTLLLAIVVELRQQRRNSIYILSLVLLIQLFFSSIGFLVGGPGASMPAYIGSVYYFSGITSFLHTGSFSTLVNADPQIGGWPAPAVFFGIILSAMGLASTDKINLVLPITRILFPLFDTILVYLIGSRIFGKKALGAILAALIYAFVGFYIPASFSDTAYTYTLFLVMMLCSFFKISSWIQTIMLPAVIIISNFYASLLVGGVIIAHSYWTRAYKHAIFYIVVLVFWSVGGFPSLYQNLARYFFARALNLSILFGATQSAFSTGSQAHHTIVLTQISITVIFLALGMFSLLLRLRKSDSPMRPFSFLFLLSIVIMGLITLVAGPGFGLNPVESIERAFFYSLPLMLLAISSFIGRRSLIVLCALLVVMTSANVVATYGGVVTTYVSPVEQQSGIFLQSYYRESNIINLVPNYYGTPSNLFYFTNSDFFLRSTIVSINSTTVIQMMNNSQNFAVGTLGRQVSIEFSSLAGSTIGYNSVLSAVYSRGDIVYANPTIQYYLILPVV
jgi:hypothetical protein